MNMKFGPPKILLEITFFSGFLDRTAKNQKIAQNSHVKDNPKKVKRINSKHSIISLRFTIHKQNP